MAWFKLRKKSKNDETGKILLKMFFGSEKDEKVALEEHRYLVKILLQRLMKNEEVSEIVSPVFMNRKLAFKIFKFKLCFFKLAE